MNTKHKTRQWAPTELPRMRRELVLAAEEAADRAVNDPKVATRLQADEEKFADHVAKTDPAMAQRLRSHPLLRLHSLADMERRHALHFRAAELYWVTRDMTRVALHASTDMPPWTPSAVIPVPIGLLIWAEDLPRIVWRGHDNNPMVPIDGVLWEQSGGYVEFIALTRTDRAITDGITTTWRAPFITVHGRVSTRVHSRYRRHVADLPVSGRPIAVWLTVRRFFCDHVDCRLQRVHVRRAGSGVDRAARAPQRRPERSTGGGRVGPGRAGGIAAGRHVGHGGESVDAAAADSWAAGSAGRSGDGAWC